jgi:predicted enzyme related to lactoylglutathione lyase
VTEVLVNVDVGDLERAIAFYCDGLGLSIGRRFGVGAVELVGASSRIYLLQNPEGSSPLPTDPHTRRAYVRHWTPVHLDFVVDDVDAAARRACAAGAQLEKPAADTAWGRIAAFADPFGHGFCLLSFNAAGYDAIAT